MEILLRLVVFFLNFRNGLKNIDLKTEENDYKILFVYLFFFLLNFDKNRNLVFSRSCRKETQTIFISFLIFLFKNCLISTILCEFLNHDGF